MPTMKTATRRKTLPSPHVVTLAEKALRQKAAARSKARSVSSPARSSKDKSRVLVLVGTRKGAFIFKSDRARKNWKMLGPHFAGWGIQHVTLD